MPGHPIPAGSVEQAKKDVATLEKLVDEHDVNSLLMDSRESRWLPIVLGSAKGKIVLHAVLGFDTSLVMQHGVRTPNTKSERLGCYYCNDIVAPSDVGFPYTYLVTVYRLISCASLSQIGRWTRCAR